MRPTRWNHFALLAMIGFLLAAAGCNSRSRGSRLERPIPGGDGGTIEVDSGLSPDDGGVVIEPDAGHVERDSGGPVLPDAGESCGSLTDCGGFCVDTYSDAEHCGECFASCGDGACMGGRCEVSCTPSCSGRTCGDDGCGGSCGTCGSGYFCSSGTCVSSCTPSCSFRYCGDDGCGGSCGTCGTGYTCSSGSCVPDAPTSGGESCSAPTVVSSSGGARTFTFSGRTANHTPFSCGSTSGNPDVVFSFTPTASGTATFAAAGPTSSTDLVLAVYSASSCTSSDELACNDDEASGVYSSRASVAVSAFSTYYVAVAPYGSTIPTDTITLTVTAP